MNEIPCFVYGFGNGWYDIHKGFPQLKDPDRYSLCEEFLFTPEEYKAVYAALWNRRAENKSIDILSELPAITGRPLRRVAEDAAELELRVLQAKGPLRVSSLPGASVTNGGNQIKLRTPPVLLKAVPRETHVHYNVFYGNEHGESQLVLLDGGGIFRPAKNPYDLWLPLATDAGRGVEGCSMPRQYLGTGILNAFVRHLRLAKRQKSKRWS